MVANSPFIWPKSREGIPGVGLLQFPFQNQHRSGNLPLR